MSVLVEHMPTRDDTERLLGIARRGQPRTLDGVAGDADGASSAAMWLGIILFLALAARLLVFALGPASDIERAMAPSSEAQLHLGDNLADHGVLSLDAAPTAAPAPYEGLPGYAAILGAAQWLGVPLEAVMMLQIALGAASAALVFGIVLALFEQRLPAIVAAVVMAVHPAGLVAANTLAAGTVFTALLLTGVWLAAARRHHDFAGSLLGGLALGLSVLVRPLSLLTGGAAAVWMLLGDRRWAGLGAAVVFAAAALTPPAAWMIRNRAMGLETWPGGVTGEVSQWVDRASDPAALASRAGDLFTAQAVDDLYARLGLGAPPRMDPSPLAHPAAAVRLAGSTDPAAWMALAWSGLNALLLIGSLVGLALLIVRGYWSAAVLLGGAMVYCVVCWPGDQAQSWRLTVVGLQAAAAGAILVRVPRRLRVRRAWFQRKAKPPEAEDLDEPMPAMTGRPL